MINKNENIGLSLEKLASYGHYSGEDVHMLCKVLDSMAAQALELKKRIVQGKHVPSWADYKIYKASDAIKSALGGTFSMKDHLGSGMPVRIAVRKINLD